MTSREQFESEAEQHFMLKERYLYWDENEEEYEDPDVQLAYEFFVLSRETLVIALPQPAVAGGSCIREHAIRECLEAAGLRVMP